MAVERDDYDSPWKEAIETFLPECLTLFFPQAHQAIDWSRGYTFLDQELRQAQPEAEIGRQIVDKLVQVYRKDGGDAWLLIHIEVQSQPDPNFERRMFTYHYRLFDRFDRQIASLAILGDERASWHPKSFANALWGTGVIRFAFRSVKLLDYRAKLDQLERNRNPFATIVVAHLRTQETRHDPSARLVAKLSMLRRFYARGYNRNQIVGLFRVIDWLMALPPELARRFWQEVSVLEQEQKMPYITSVERIGREEGLKEGLKEGHEAGLRDGLIEGIELILRAKFGPAGQQIIPEIRQLTEVSAIRSIYARLESAETLDDLHRVIAKHE